MCSSFLVKESESILIKSVSPSLPGVRDKGELQKCQIKQNKKEHRSNFWLFVHLDVLILSSKFTEKKWKILNHPILCSSKENELHFRLLSNHTATYLSFHWSG